MLAKRRFAGARHPDRGRGRRAGRLHAVLVRALGPQGTPKDIVAKLNAAVVDALADPAVRARLADLGQEIPPRDQQTPEALAAFHKAEIDKWWPIIKAAEHQGAVSSRDVARERSDETFAACACAFATLAGITAAQRANLSVAADHHGRAVPGRRADRYASRASWPSACAALGQPHHREHRRRRRHASASAASRARRPTATRSASATGARTSSTARSITLPYDVLQRFRAGRAARRRNPQLIVAQEEPAGERPARSWSPG